jgi:hypothetical protein
MNDLIEAIAGVIFCLAALAVPVAGIIWLVEVYEEKQCNTYSQVTARATQYRTGMCYIKDGGEWYAWSEYKSRNATTGVKP